mmetsp:Transcript_2425/g.9286  ORF Transcript_2425/g.9286 Transcript_2425/m.9286 type:complete len:208 (+) Transcript_2425:526-1149(+)
MRNLAAVLVAVVSWSAWRRATASRSSAMVASSARTLLSTHASKSSASTSQAMGNATGTRSDTHRSSSHDTTWSSKVSAVTRPIDTSWIVEMAACDRCAASRESASRCSARSTSPTELWHWSVVPRRRRVVGAAGLASVVVRIFWVAVADARWAGRPPTRYPSVPWRAHEASVRAAQSRVLARGIVQLVGLGSGWCRAAVSVLRSRWW